MTSSTYPTMQWSLPLANWAYWHADMDNPPPLDLQFIDMGLRRKLSLLAKHSLSIAHQCAGSHLDIHIVYASRNGDIARTTAMLIDMAHGEMPSPTGFSMSVLNATVGAYSIATANHTANTAISANASSFGFGLLEAHMQLLSKPTVPVLFIYADEPPPMLYQAEHPDMPAHTIAMLFHTPADHMLECRITQQHGNDSAVAQSLAMTACLQTGQSTWQGEQRSWEWNLHVG